MLVASQGYPIFRKEIEPFSHSLGAAQREQSRPGIAELGRSQRQRVVLQDGCSAEW